MKESRKHVYIFLPLLLLTLTLIFNLGLYFTHSLPSFGKFFDGDVIYLPTLFRDLFVNNGSFSDWYGSAAPYLFPDMFVYFISNFIFSDFYYAIPLFFTINSLILIYILYIIYRHFFQKIDALYLCAISFSIIYLIPLDTYIFQFVSVFHFGQFIAGLISIYLILEILTNPKKKIYIVLLIVSSLTVASDTLYIVGFILPTIATMLILWSGKILNNKKLIYIFSTLISSILFGKLLDSFIIQNRSDYRQATTLSLKHLQQNIQNIISIAQNSYIEHTFMTIVIATVYILMILFLFLYKRIETLKLDKNNISKVFYLSIYLIIMFLGYILAVSFIYPQSVYIHYLVPIFLMPIFMFVIIYKWIKLDLYKPRFFKTLNLSLIVILFFILGVKSYEYFKDATLKTQYYPPLVSCIDSFIKRTGAQDGIANFWDSKPINMLSKNNINIVQVNHDLSPYLAVTNKSWYKDYYDFALIRDNLIDKKKLLLLNGEPTEVFECENLEIFYYKEKLITDSFLKYMKQLSNILNKNILFNSKKVLFSGWSFAEKTHRWSLGHSSNIYFKIQKDIPIKGNLDIVFRTLKEQKIIIYINNHKIADKVFNGSNISTSFVFNPNILNTNSINTIKFEFPNAHKPNNDDQRILAMGLKSFSVE